MNGKLYIGIDGAKSVVDIKGETATILFLWAGLTNIICKKTPHFSLHPGRNAARPGQ